jgi:hypothetical protein
LKGFALGRRGIRIEAHRQGFYQRRPIRPLERIEPGMTLGHLAAGQPNPHRAIQPAGALSQRGEQRLAQQQALTGGSYRPKPQFASLVSPMQYNTPGKSRPLLPVPFKYPDQLLAQGVDYKGRWHVLTSGKWFSE